MTCFIVEDNIIQAESLKKIIKNQAVSLNITFDNYILSCKLDYILANIHKSLQPNIYFVDIEIREKKTRGFEIATEIRKIDTVGTIIFITSHGEMAQLSYSYLVSALSFIEKKPQLAEFEQKIFSCLKQYKASMNFENEEYFIYNTKYSSVKARISEMLYFMTSEAHKIELICTHRTISFYGNLNSIQKTSQNFIRIHKSYVVAIDKIVEVDKRNREIKLLNNDILPISKKLYKEFMDAWNTLRLEDCSCS